MAKIGILGGTFDPIHNGHLALGKQAYEQFGLDEIWFMLSGHPPHKKGRLVTEGKEREDMVKLAIASVPYFVYSDFELKREGNTYTAQKKDNIMNNKKVSGSQIDVALITTNRAGTLIRLTIGQKPETDDPLLVYSKIESMEDVSVTLDTTVPQGELYYVYAYGSLDCIYTDPAAAVKRADDQTGVVLNRAQQYVWERGNKKTKIQLNIEDVPEIIRTANWKKQELQDGLGDAGTVIDLTGCSLDNVLYEVSAQRPVIAKTGDNSSVVIVGYDEYNTYLYDPSTGQTSPYGMNDSTALFESAGNVFLTYIENVTE